MKQIWIKTAQTMADIADNIARQYFRQPIERHYKEDGSAVCSADLAIEKALRDYLQTHHPQHGVLGEEYEETDMQSDYTWVIDPIDGTASFLSGKPTFCTLIALLEKGTPILGLISQPILRERWLGIRGERTLFNGKAISALPAPEDNKIRFSCTTPLMFKSVEEKQVYQALSQQASICSYGGDAYSYGLLALGHIDMILEADLAYYDIAALIPIIEGVEGRLTNWQGQAITSEDFEGQVIALTHHTITRINKDGLTFDHLSLR